MSGKGDVILIDDTCTCIVCEKKIAVGGWNDFMADTWERTIQWLNQMSNTMFHQVRYFCKAFESELVNVVSCHLSNFSDISQNFNNLVWTK